LFVERECLPERFGSVLAFLSEPKDLGKRPICMAPAGLGTWLGPHQPSHVMTSRS
jgi:hypothetical protein